MTFRKIKILILFCRLRDIYKNEDKSVVIDSDSKPKFQSILTQEGSKLVKNKFEGTDDGLKNFENSKIRTCTAIQNEVDGTQLPQTVHILNDSSSHKELHKFQKVEPSTKNGQSISKKLLSPILNSTDKLLYGKDQIESLISGHLEDNSKNGYGHAKTTNVSTTELFTLAKQPNKVCVSSSDSISKQNTSDITISPEILLLPKNGNCSSDIESHLAKDSCLTSNFTNGEHISLRSNPSAVLLVENTPDTNCENGGHSCSNKTQSIALSLPQGVNQNSYEGTVIDEHCHKSNESAFGPIDGCSVLSQISTKDSLEPNLSTNGSISADISNSAQNNCIDSNHLETSTNSTMSSQPPSNNDIKTSWEPPFCTKSARSVSFDQSLAENNEIAKISNRISNLIVDHAFRKSSLPLTASVPEVSS